MQQTDILTFLSSHELGTFVNSSRVLLSDLMKFGSSMMENGKISVLYVLMN